MKGKDKKALHTKTPDELVTLLKQKREELARKKIEIRMNKEKNVHAGQMLKREIAIIETIKRARQLAEEVKNG